MSAPVVRVPVLIVPPTAPPLGWTSSLLVFHVSSSGGSNDEFSRNLFQMDLDGVSLSDTGVQSVGGPSVGAPYGARAFSMTKPAISNGGTLYLTANLGGVGDSGTLPLSDSGVVVAMVYDVGIEFPYGYLPWHARLVGFFQNAPRTSVTANIAAETGPWMTIMAMAAIGADSAGLSFADPSIVIQNFDLIAANNALAAWGTYLSPYDDPDAFLYGFFPPAHPSLSFTWSWSPSTLYWNVSFQFFAKPLAPPPVLTRGRSYAQIIG